MSPTELLLAGVLLSQPQPAPCTSAGAYDVLAGCPGTGTPAFARQPVVKAVDACTGGSGTADGACISWYYSFPHAATFPLPRFDQNGMTIAGDGLVIYEGMRLTVNDTTGVYDLNFTATVPETAVTVRLQLRFERKNNAADVFHITLPPIRLEPPRDARPGDPAGNTFQVNHRGYSLLFQKPNPGVGEPLHVNNWKITRLGTARFGTPLAQEATGR